MCWPSYQAWACSTSADTEACRWVLALSPQSLLVPSLCTAITSISGVRLLRLLWSPCSTGVSNISCVATIIILVLVLYCILLSWLNTGNVLLHLDELFQLYGPIL